MRLEVTRRAELAVRALALLGADGGRMKAGRLAENLDTTTGFVAQVVNPLVKAGWVRSEPGPGGGYSMRPEAAAVSVLDVIETVDGPTDDGRCVVADRPCDSGTPCVIHTAWRHACAELRSALGRMPAAGWNPAPPSPSAHRLDPPA